MKQETFYVLWKKDRCINSFNTYDELVKYFVNNKSDIFTKVIVSSDFDTLKHFYSCNNNIIELEDNYKIEERVVFVSDFSSNKYKESIKKAYNWFISEIKNIKSNSKSNFSEVEKFLYDKEKN